LRSECGSISWPRMWLARSVRIVNGRELPAGSGMVHGAVVLLNVNDSPRHRQTGMSAAPAARPAPASRPSSRLPNELIDYSILGLLWNGTPYFPRAGVPQDQSADASKGYGCGRFSVRGRFLAARVGVRTNLRRRLFAGGMGFRDSYRSGRPAALASQLPVCGPFCPRRLRTSADGALFNPLLDSAQELLRFCVGGLASLGFLGEILAQV
jgi:hypothetical protein